MRNFQQKRGFRNILHSRPVLVLLSILLLVFAWSVIGFMGKMQMTVENRRIAENKVTELESQKENLLAEIAKLNTEDGREESIREKFPVAQEGEGVIVIIEDKSQSEAEDTKSKGFFSFLSFLLFWK